MIDYHRTTKQILAELSETLQSVDPGETLALKDALLQTNRVFIAGKGRSGLLMRAFAMRLMHLNRSVFVVDDVTTPSVTENDLLLIGSGSGRTPSLIHYAERAKSVGAKLALITGDPQSPIAAQADLLAHIPASNQKSGTPSAYPPSILPMGSRFEFALGLLCEIIVLQLMEDLHMTSDSMFLRHANLE